MIHTTKNEAMLASCTGSAPSKWSSTIATATVEIVKPRKAIDQNGRTSDLKLLRPR
jgi:hypothetical protein